MSIPVRAWHGSSRTWYTPLNEATCGDTVFIQKQGCGFRGYAGTVVATWPEKRMCQVEINAWKDAPIYRNYWYTELSAE